MTKQKFNVGALVYFVGLDNRCQWAVFGTTIKAVHRINGLWCYDLNTQPFAMRRVEHALYRDYASAKAQVVLNNIDEKISPKRDGRKTSCDKTSYKMRPNLF